MLRDASRLLSRTTGPNEETGSRIARKHPVFDAFGVVFRVYGFDFPDHDMGTASNYGA